METCGICRRRIRDNLEMCYCSYCNMTFHFTCIEEQPCPNCGRVLNVAHVRLGKPTEIYRKEKDRDVFVEEVNAEQGSESLSPVEESFEKQGVTEKDIPERMKTEFYSEESSQMSDMQKFSTPPMGAVVERGKTLKRRDAKKKLGISRKKLLFILLVAALVIINIIVIFYVLNDGTVPFLNIKFGGKEAVTKTFFNY